MYSEEILLENYTEKQIFILAVQTLHELDWEIEYLNQKNIKAITKNSFASNFNDIYIVLKENGLTIKSKGFYQLFSKNKSVFFVKEYKEMLNSLLETLKEEEFEEIYDEIIEEYEFIPDEKITENELPFYYVTYPNKYFKATPILLYINLFVFIYHLFLGASLFDNPVEFFIDNGGNNLFFSMIYKQWRLVTSIFTHSGVFHLLSNIFSLLLVGYLLEKIVKSYYFIISYLFFGIMANLSSIYWSDLSVSVGASGAIFGLFGLLISISFFYKNAQISKARLKYLTILVIYNLMYGFSHPNIDNAAHLGGFIIGLLFGFVFYFFIDKLQNFRYKFILTSLVIIVSLVSYQSIRIIKNDIIYSSIKLKKLSLNISELDNIRIELYDFLKFEKDNGETFYKYLIGEKEYDYKHLIGLKLRYTQKSIDNEVILDELIKTNNYREFDSVLVLLNDFHKTQRNYIYYTFSLFQDFNNFSEEKFLDYQKEIQNFTSQIQNKEYMKKYFLYKFLIDKI